MADLLRVLFLLANLATPPSIKDYGVHGRTFPIEEENLIEHIQSRIQNTGEERFQKYCVETYKEPQAVVGLIDASVHAIHYFDPTIITKVDIRDGEDRIIITKGSSYNPLEFFSLAQDLLFFDGDQKEHVQWARSMGKESKWILVKGKPFQLEEQENYPVYFDQRGLLVQKLSIKAIPAKVTQEGTRLKIESIPIEELTCGS